MKTVLEAFKLESVTQGDGFVCGVEYEIECIKHIDKTPLVSVGLFPDVQDDPSLRNSGVEVISPPLSYESQLLFFNLLHKKCLTFYDGNPFSDRTSTHVHVNFQNVSLEKLDQFVLLYILFEPHFFSLVDESRSSSIYCVPLNHTALSKYYDQGTLTMRAKWHKYTAFNILPLAIQGTIEFRHLHGTNDEETFTTWLSTIKRLYDFNLSTKVDFLTVLKDVDSFKRLVFPDCSVCLKDTSLDVKLAVNNVTYAALLKKIAAKLNKTPAHSMAEMAEKLSHSMEVPF